MARQQVQALPAQPPVISLLASADVSEDGERWHGGIQWSPEQVLGGGVLPVNCAGGNPDGKPLAPVPGLNAADPFAVYADDTCSTIGFEARDYEPRARRQLAAVQSFYVAQEVQYGAIAGLAGGGENASLIDGVVVGPAGPPEEALGALEGAAGAAYGGARCFIHVTIQTLDWLAAHNLIFREGQKWVTYPGNIVVADAGYGPEGGTAFMYATPPVKVRLSPVLVVPGSFPEAMSQATAIATNLVTVYAERLALVQFDHAFSAPADLILKIELDMPIWTFGS